MWLLKVIMAIDTMYFPASNCTDRFVIFCFYHMLFAYLGTTSTDFFEAEAITNINRMVPLITDEWSNGLAIKDFTIFLFFLNLFLSLWLYWWFWVEIQVIKYQIWTINILNNHLMYILAFCFQINETTIILYIHSWIKFSETILWFFVICQIVILWMCV